jgi:multiple sugar transport system permease protein
MSLRAVQIRTKGDRTQLPYRQSFFDKYAGPIYLLPAVAVILLVTAVPIISTIHNSFTNRSLIMRTFDYVGWENYVRVLSDRSFWSSLIRTVVWTCGSVSLQILIGLAVALLLNRATAFKGLFRTLIIIPWAFPLIVTAFMWLWILNDVYGIVNIVLMRSGIISEPILFFGTGFNAMATVILLNVWFGYPLIAVNIIAVLQTIPQELYEVAALDGANGRQMFFHITLPHIILVITLLGALRIIWVFNLFGRVFLFTGGGPASATTILSIYTYQTGWAMGQMGRASAITIITLIMILLFFRVYYMILDRVEESYR